MYSVGGGENKKAPLRTNEPFTETLAGDIRHVCLATAKVEHFFQFHNRSPQHLTKFNISHHKGRMFFPFYHPILQKFYKNSTLLAIYQQLKGDSIPTHYEGYTKHIRRKPYPLHKIQQPTSNPCRPKQPHQAQKNPHLWEVRMEGFIYVVIHEKYLQQQSF